MGWPLAIWAGCLVWPQLASRLGSARRFSEPRKEARLGSFQAREPLRTEPSRTEPEPSFEPRAFFPALMTGIHERVGVLARPVDLTGHPRSLMRVAPRAPPAPCGRGRHRVVGSLVVSPCSAWVQTRDRQTAGPVRPFRSYAVDLSCTGGRAGRPQGAPCPVASAGYSYLVGRDKDACGRDGMGHAARDG